MFVTLAVWCWSSTHVFFLLFFPHLSCSEYITSLFHLSTGSLVLGGLLQLHEGYRFDNAPDHQ